MNNKKIIDITPPKPSSNFKAKDEAIRVKIDYKSKKNNAKEAKIWSIPEQKTRPSNNRTMPFANINTNIKMLNRKKILIFSLLFAVIIGTFAFFSLLGIEVEIRPAFSEKIIKKEIIIDTSADELNFSESIIPGKLLQEEGKISQQFNSSGVSLEETKAEGVIQVYNNYRLTQILVATTRFLSSDEKLFRSKKRVSIPSGSSADVEVIAAEPGPEYNIEPSTFSVPGLVGSPRYTSVYGKSFSAMSGGFSGQTAIVAKSDLKNAEDVLKQKLSIQLTEKLASRSNNSSFALLKDTIVEKVIETNSLAPARTKTEQFNYTVRMNSTAMALQKQDLENFAKEIISQEIKQDQSIAPNSLKIEHAVKSVNLNTGRAELELEISAKIYSDINIASLKNKILGMSLKQGQQDLTEDSRIFTAQIRGAPFWKRSFPKNVEKININIILDTNNNIID